MFSEDDNKLQYNNFNLIKKNVEFNTSLDHGLSNIKCEFDEEETKKNVLENQLCKEKIDITTLHNSEFAERFLKTELRISDMFSEDKCGATKSEDNEKNEEFKKSLDLDFSNVKCEFGEEETKIQCGVLEEEVTRDSATVISTGSGATLQKIEPTILSNNESHICGFCSQSFNSTETLNIHRRIHIEELYKYGSFDKDFSQQSELNRNIKIHKEENPCKIMKKRHKNRHTKFLTSREGEKPFKCETCGKSFNDKSGLNRHLRIHTGEKPFECETCGKTFNQKINLNSHMRIHTGENPFKCETCGKSFSLKVNLTTHLRSHTGEKPFKCETCGTSFSHKISLNSHMRIHTGEKPFKCETCGKSFRLKITLNSHVRVHTGERPFKCEICGKCFGDNGKLKRHTRIHTGEKSIKCQTCGQGFSQKFDLFFHLNMHIEEKPSK